MLLLLAYKQSMWYPSAWLYKKKKKHFVCLDACNDLETAFDIVIYNG